MLIIANTLAFNGGATFILRFCRKYASRNTRCAVLVLINGANNDILLELQKYADVYFLSSFSKFPIRRFFNSPLAGFLPLNKTSLLELFERYGNQVHVMGIFGILLMARLSKESLTSFRISIGIYHQNEFMYRDVKYYFSCEAQRIFRSLANEGVIFFNEENRSSYSRFFSLDLSRATTIPIGIDLAEINHQSLGSPTSRRIVSIGNLVNFKTYNSHLIRCLPELVLYDDNLTYEIYGDGPEQEQLKLLARKLGVSNIVFFKGAIPYSEMSSVLSGAFIFVGSGTAILEAAAFGIPSLIGIESTKDPISYGFLNEIDGLSYNELTFSKPLHTFISKISRIIQSSDYWYEVATGCKKKAEFFSIDRTIEGFKKRNLNAATLDQQLVADYSNIKALLSFIGCVTKHLLGIDTRFANRRNQGSVS
jgi:glycosyltransferase involved in cell wall biosynthesis